MNKALWAALYVALIVGTNVSFSIVGPVLVTFVLVGLTLVARDLIQAAGGRWLSIGLIGVGALLSAVLAAPAVALASAVAFLLSESLDALIYSTIRRRNFLAGVATSGVVGSVVDSAVFLGIAFGSLAFFWPQFVGKAAAVLGSTVVLWLVRRVRAGAVLA